MRYASPQYLHRQFCSSSMYKSHHHTRHQLKSPYTVIYGEQPTLAQVFQRKQRNLLNTPLILVVAIQSPLPHAKQFKEVMKQKPRRPTGWLVSTHKEGMLAHSTFNSLGTRGWNLDLQMNSAYGTGNFLHPPSRTI